MKDVNEDGLDDLVLRFRTQEASIVCGDTSAALTGETFDGWAIVGTDSIQTVGCKIRKNGDEDDSDGEEEEDD